MKRGIRKTGIVVAAVLAAAGLALPVCGGRAVRFAEETVVVDAFPDEILVTGTYSFRNTAAFPIVATLRIPFPVDAQHPEPREVRAWPDGDPARAIRVARILGECYIAVSFRARERKRIRIVYRQAAPDRSASYIVTTTRFWGRPLEHATFRWVPHGVKLVQSNYGFDAAANGAIEFQRRDFMPEEDWHFAWEAP